MLSTIFPISSNLNFTQKCFVPSLVEIGPVFLDHEKEIFYFVNVFPFSLLSFCEKGRGHLFKQNSVPFTQGCFVPSYIEISQIVQGKILKFSMYSDYFVFISPLIRIGLFLTNLNPLFCIKFG